MALKPPVSIAQARRSPKAAKRRKSFCARMGGMRKKLTSAKTANDPNSRINRALADWDCDIPELLPREYVTRRIRVSNPEALMGVQRPHWDISMGEQFDHPGRDSDIFDENPRARMVQRVPSMIKAPFKYVAQVRPDQWIFTLARPGATVTDWQGAKMPVLNSRWYRLPAAVTNNPRFHQWVAKSWRIYNGTAQSLDQTLRQFTKR